MKLKMNSKLLALLPMATVFQCALSNLGEGLEQDGCVGQPFTFCDELNQINPSTDQEKEWRCDESIGVCSLLSVDIDNDGVGADKDCDDNDPMRSPEKKEICDGVDNDCNNVVDDGAAYTAVANTSPLVTEVAGTLFENVDVAQDESSKSTLVLYQVLDGLLNLPHVIHLEGENGTVMNSGHLRVSDGSVTSQSLALAREGLNRFKVAIGRRSGSRDLTVGDVPFNSNNMQPPNQIDFDVENPNSVPPVGTSFSSLEMNEENYLGSYILHNPSGGDGCGSLESQGTSKEILLYNANDESVPSVAIGETTDPSPAALLSVGSNRWFVGYADGANKKIIVKSVSLDGTGAVSIIATPLLMIDTTGVPGQVDLALSDDRKNIAVTYRDGCGSTDIGLVLADYNVQDNSITNTEAIVIDRIGNQRAPDIMWRKAPSKGWIIAFDENRMSTFVAMLDIAGQPLSPYLEVDPEGPQGSRLSGPRLIKGFSENGFAIINPIRKSDAQSEIRLTQLQCNAQ